MNDDAFLDTFNFVPVVVSYCPRCNHTTAKQQNPAVSYATVDGRSGGVRSLSRAGSASGASPDGWIGVSEAKFR